MEEVLAFVSHDVRNPLNNICMSLDLLGDDTPLGSPTHEVLGPCRLNVNRLKDMVESLLTATRLRAGHDLAVEYKPCDLATDLRQEFELEYRGSPGPLGFREIQRAITNLLTNAKNYGHPDRHPPRVRTQPRTSADLGSQRRCGDSVGPTRTVVPRLRKSGIGQEREGVGTRAGVRKGRGGSARRARPNRKFGA